MWSLMEFHDCQTFSGGVTFNIREIIERCDFMEFTAYNRRLKYSSVYYTFITEWCEFDLNVWKIFRFIFIFWITSFHFCFYPRVFKNDAEVSVDHFRKLVPIFCHVSFSKNTCRCILLIQSLVFCNKTAQNLTICILVCHYYSVYTIPALDSRLLILLRSSLRE